MLFHIAETTTTNSTLILINDEKVTIAITADDEEVTIRLTNNWRTKLMIVACMALVVMLLVTALYVWMKRFGLVGPRGPTETLCDPQQLSHPHYPDAKQVTF